VGLAGLKTAKSVILCPVEIIFAPYATLPDGTDTLAHPLAALNYNKFEVVTP
jgi:hypothetical protein